VGFERCWGQGFVCVGDVREVLVGGVSASEFVVEVGSGGQLKWVSTSPLICVLLILRLAERVLRSMFFISESVMDHSCSDIGVRREID